MIICTIYFCLTEMILAVIFRCIKLSLVHDLAESIVGDIAPADGVDKEEKYRREKVSICFYIPTSQSESEERSKQDLGKSSRCICPIMSQNPFPVNNSSLN